MNTTPPPPGALPDKEARNWGAIAHLGGLIGLVVPLGTILTPLIVWLVYKERSAFVDYHGKEALNFQLTVLIGIVISILLTFLFVGFVTLIIIAVCNIVFSIVAASAASKGIRYVYPLTIRIIR